MSERLSDAEKAQIEKLLEVAIGGYREHLHPDAVAHVQADFAQLLDGWSSGHLSWSPEGRCGPGT